MYQIRNDTENGMCEVLMYDDIGMEGITAREVVAQLQGISAVRDLHGGLTLRISSQGGDLFEALAMYNYIKGLTCQKVVQIDGICASAASVIAMCGDVVRMADNALFMIHNPWGYCQGDADDMRDSAEMLDKVRDSCMKVYQARTKLTPKELRSMMDAETWMSAGEAKAKGFVDEVIPGRRAEGRSKELTEAYEAGVKAERERLRELDSLMTPERAPVIVKAKYETCQTAQDIALTLLRDMKGEMKAARQKDSYDTQITPVMGRMKSEQDEEIRQGVIIINRMRGYKS